MEALQIFDTVIDNLDLLLNNRHPPGKVVVFPDFAGQFGNLCLHDSLILAVGNQDANKGDSAGDNGCDNAFRQVPLLKLLQPSGQKSR